MGRIIQLHGEQAAIFMEWLAYYRKLRQGLPGFEKEPTAIERTDAFIQAKRGNHVPGTFWGALAN